MSQGTYLAINQQKLKKGAKKEKNINIGFSYIFLILAGFVLGQAEIISGLFPLALIYWIIMVRVKQNLVIGITILTGAGLLLSGDYYNLSYVIAAIIGFILFKLLTKKNNLSLALFISITYLVVSLIMCYLRQVILYKYFLHIGEFIFIYILSYIGCQGMMQIFDRTKKLSKLSLVTVFIISCGLLVGMINISFIPAVFVNIVVLVFLMAAAYTIGFSAGILTAVLYGLALTSLGMIPILTMMRYIVLSLFCGIFQQKNKFWITIGSIIGFLFYSGFAPTIYNLTNALVEISVALAVFLIIPASLWKKTFSSLIKKTDINLNKIEINSQLHNNFNQHLLELSSVFNELSLTFKEVIPEYDSESSVEDFLFIFKNKVCGSCNRKSICWQQEKSNTSKRILLLLKSAENKGYIDSDTSKKYLSNKCYQDQKLPVIKFSFEMYQINNFWKERLSDKQLIVSEQLEGISEIIDQFSSKTMFALGNNIPEYNIKKKALKASIDILNIEQSYNINSTRVNIQVELEPCTGNSPCKNQLCEIINSEYNYNFRVVSHNCGSKIKNIPCQIIYSPQGKYRLELSQQQRASKNGVSGDSYLYKPLKDGKDLIVLSDGMGVGRKAECESMAAINLLETIIDAGFDEKLAINTINSALYLRNKEESFTTLDIAIFDTFTGQISFSKIGAVSSYIKRDWDLIEIDSASLPAGILNKIEVSTKTKLLKENDFVIMFTDGVIDSYSAGKDQEECVRRLLQNSSFETAEEMVNYIMEVVLSEDKEIKDDMTIAVFKIKKDEKKSRIINDFSRIK